MTYTEIIRNKNELYTQMTNKELLDAYNASGRWAVDGVGN